MNIKDEFPIGMLVRKVSGYDWPGKVCGYSMPSTNTLTVNVENRLCPGTIHVFPPRHLMAEDRTDDEILLEVISRLLQG